MRFKIFNFAKSIWSFNRSLTGEGNRKTLKIIKKNVNLLNIKNIKSGTKCFDWVIPLEWKVEEAFLIDPNGKKICNFEKNNLHLVGYSISIDKFINFNELKNHLHFLKEQPSAIPYVTSYYKKNWGFCLSYNDYKKLKKGNYRVIIKTKHFKGQLDYGELIIKGKAKKEILLSTNICHPSMANNEISGITVLTALAAYLTKKNNYYTYRLIFIPETIGSIFYISKNKTTLKKNVVAGFVLSCLGDERSYSFLPSKYGNSLSDLAAEHIFKWKIKKFRKYDWIDRGSDERQYCSPGVDLPIASVMRTKHGEYKEYHTSLDRLGTVVTEKGLTGGFNLVKDIIGVLESNIYPVSNFYCEPNLGKKNLYPTTSKKDAYNKEFKYMMEILTWADGKNSLLDISNKLKVPLWELLPISNRLKLKGVIKYKKYKMQ